MHGSVILFDVHKLRAHTDIVYDFVCAIHHNNIQYGASHESIVDT